MDHTTKQKILDHIEAAHTALHEDRLDDARVALQDACSGLASPEARTARQAERLEARIETLASILSDGKTHTMRELRGRLCLNNANVKPVLDEAVRRGIARKIDHNVRPGLAFLYVQC